MEHFLEASYGRDAVLRETEVEARLLQLLPVKAQLGFSSLKEHFSQRGEQRFKRFLQSTKPHDAMKLEYTCIDSSDDFIVLGCNFGIVFFFDRQFGRLQRFVSEAKQVPIVCLKILTSQNFVATGQFNGALTIFNYGREKDGNYKVMLKCTIDNHHLAPVTCIQWTPDGTKLFSGDSEGNVAISVINMDDCQTHTVFICNENSPVTQLSLCPTALLVSTLKRSLIWPFNTKMPVQVGQQERKVHGNFGACFFPSFHYNPSQLVVYATRPGLRIWCANLEGKVSATMIFKDSIAKGEPEITTLNPSRNDENSPTSEPKQFGPLKVFFSYLLSWQGSCLWVMDPNKGTVIGCHSNFDFIVDVSICNNDIFVLTKGDKTFVRKISLETQSQSPLIEVRELHLNEHENEVKIIHRSGSVNQFEEADRLEKLFGDMKNTTVGLIGVVKRNVVKTFEHIKNLDDSEEDKSLTSDDQVSENSSCPSSSEEQFGVNGSIRNNPDLNLKNESFNEVKDQNFDATFKTTEANEEVSLDLGKVGHDVSHHSCSSPSDTQNLPNFPTEVNEATAEITIQHKCKEEPIPFHHISEEAFSSDIVFEGTSKKKVKRKKTKKRDQCSNEDSMQDILDVSRSPDSRNTDTLMRYNNGSNADSNERLISAQASSVSNMMNIAVTDCGKIVHDDLADNPHSDDGNQHPPILDAIIKPTQEEERFHHNMPMDETNNIQENNLPEVKHLVVDSDVQKHSAEMNKTCQQQAIPNAYNKDYMYGTKEHKDFQENEKIYDANQVVHPVYDKQSHKEIVETNTERCNEKEMLNAEENNVTLSHNQDHNDLFEPGEVLNVEISKQREGGIKSVPGKACKRIDGEAVEQANMHSGDSICLYLHREDTIDSNVCWLDEDDGRLHVDDSPPHSPHYREPSLFPAPQMNYSSIYSQETVSISDMSFSEPENNIDVIPSTPSQNTALIDSLSMLSISSEQTDIEDNQCPTPPINLDASGGIVLSDTLSLQHKNGYNSGKNSSRYSSCSSPSFLDIDAPLPPSPHSMAEKVSERLRLLADSWADVSTPNCGYIHSLTVTDTLVWCVDSHDHIFATSTSSANVNWKKIDGKARHIAANQAGSIVWNVSRKKIAYCRLNVRANLPQGTDWEFVETEILEVAVDDKCVWCIKTNGDVLLRSDVSPQKPQGTAWKCIRVASDLVHITCLGCMVWGLDIYNHVQIYQGNLSSLTGNEQAIQWLELPGISATYVSLGPKGVCWIIDKDGKVWFNLELSEENIFGGRWYELSVGEYLVQDPTVLSAVVSFFKRGNQPKTLAGNDIAGLWILGKHGSLHAARGHLLGTRWDLTVPIAMPSSVFWSHVSAQGSTGNGGFVWALQPNGDLHCFRPESQSFFVQPPLKKVLKYISASPRSLWALTSNQDLYIRRGICETTPQGLKWMAVNMMSMGSERIYSIACGILVVWAVDYHGNIWFQMGRDDKRHVTYSPAWVPVEGSPFDGCQFIKVAVGSNDSVVWAIDDKNNVYARKEVSANLLIGTAWEIVAGTGAKDITVSDNMVWALCPNGNVVCRFGISDRNYTGDYWKTVPGCFEHISVAADDELWGIDRQGQLYQRHTVHFFGTQATRKTPSYSQLFPTDNDWELI